MTTKSEEKKVQVNNEETNLGGLSISILIISVVVIVFSFFAPLLFVQETRNGINFNDTGEIGDTIGGLMNPFIAIAGVLLTFLAFYIQFKANRIQRASFKEQLNEQQTQFSKTQFENQFYEMLKLHKDNVNELQISMIRFLRISINDKEKYEEIIRGRRVCEFLIKELELCYYIAKANFPSENYTVWINEAYGVFYHGLNPLLIEKHKYFKDLYDIKTLHQAENFSFLNKIIRGKYEIEGSYDLHYPIFGGYSSQLAHYFRHLFQTVKFIASQNEDFIAYEEKRKYLRILRAQLSNQEQALLFYNWFSNFGKQWENETNKYFTDFRMIHNIYQAILIPDIELSSEFDLDGGYRKESNRKTDPLFEFQDW